VSFGLSFWRSWGSARQRVRVKQVNPSGWTRTARSSFSRRPSMGGVPGIHIRDTSSSQRPSARLTSGGGPAPARPTRARPPPPAVAALLRGEPGGGPPDAPRLPPVEIRGVQLATEIAERVQDLQAKVEQAHLLLGEPPVEGLHQLPRQG